ncbi:MAG: RrF2 family transcriptional regulator [Solirubrobacteraceae bacterium]
MFFTTKAEYGVRLLVALGRQAGGEPVSLKSIAEADGLPMGYLEHITPSLRRAGLLESTRGSHGGYRLARDPAEIRMDEALLALEGIVAPMDCLLSGSSEEERAMHRVMCSHEGDQGRSCATKLLWMRVQGDVMRALGRTTLAELVSFSERGAAATAEGAIAMAPTASSESPIVAPPIPVLAGDERKPAVA